MSAPALRGIAAGMIGPGKVSETMTDILSRIKRTAVVPVVALPDAQSSLRLAEALKAGGLSCMEITFRTEAGREGLRLVKKEFPDFLLGAGTVTTIDELKAAQDAGADFAVAPGMNPRIVKKASDLGLPFYPGVCTPTEIEIAMDYGATTLKFFPAEAMGGLNTVKALHAPYKHRGISFIPTGGIRQDTLASYLLHEGVRAVGGTWLAPMNLLQEGNWTEVEKVTRATLEIVRQVRKEAD